MRLVGGEAGTLEELRSSDALPFNELIAAEGARTIERPRLQGSLSTVQDR